MQLLNPHPIQPKNLTTDLIRPLVISQAARIAFLVVMSGVLGGLAAFGLIGWFVGPAILAVWREWLEEGVQ